MGITDGIERFLQDLIQAADGAIEIQRNTLANHFGCVPSQINYVIQTRFTTERGYIVESRRGGGGYIKIKKTIIPEGNYIMHMVNSIGDSIDYQTASVFIRNLLDYKKISEREARILLSAQSDNILNLPMPLKDNLRASLFKNMLVSLIV